MREISKVIPYTPPLKRKRVAAYARVSSGKEAMLTSLAAQVSYFSGYIQKRLDWQYAGVYADEAVTGTREERPEFQRLMNDCRAGLIELIVTKAVTRFARNTLTTLKYVRELSELGVDVYFLNENVHSMSGDGELMLTILASYAQEESRSVSENCKWRIRKRMEDGELVGFFGMYGYDYIDGKNIINEERAAVIRQMFAWYIGGMGISAIAQRLNAEGVPCYFGGRWTAARVGYLLGNEKLTGNALLQKYYSENHLTKKQLMNKGELPQYYVEDTHPAIIDTATYEAAQRIRAERAAHYNAKDTSKNTYPFTGLIHCDYCGKRYKRKKGVGRFYWQCSTFLQEGKAVCPAKQIPENTLFHESAAVLGLAAFDGAAFINQITEIRVPDANRLAFVFSNGNVAHREWQDRSRRESWTEEMREVARNRQLDIIRKGAVSHV
jgi:DNA invertase Pin-like site-specific DNA recombinase